MDRPTSNVLAQLGLAEGDVEDRGEECHALPVQPLALGRGEAIQSAAALIASGDIAPIESALLAHKGLRAMASNVDSRVVALELADHSFWIAGSVEQIEDGVVVFDLRDATRESAIVVNGGAPVMAWADTTTSPPQLRVNPLKRRPSGPAHGGPGIGLRLDVTVAEQARLSIPSLESLLGGFRAQAWLVEEWTKLSASRTAFRRAAACGLVARLWTPVPEERARANERLSGPESPSARVAGWWSQLGADHREQIEDEAISAADGLTQRLESLRTWIAEDHVEARVGVISLLLGRDDLESVAWLARPDEDSSIGRAIRHLDDSASAQLTALSAVDVSSVRRLAEVSWQEPEAWWGALAGPR